MSYDFQKIEKKWQKYWEEEKINYCDLNDDKKAKFYNLAMFFYPSGSKIHIGHAYNYSGSDVFGRYKRLKGFNVFQPMGYDAFGLPAENYAIKKGVHPAKSTRENIDFGKKQLKKMGFMYDWEKEINTSSPEYYKWTQWIFSVLYKAGLAERKEAPVNWCPSCKTVLANEQVREGRCERCDSEVQQKKLKQWFFKITNYADQLLEGHKKLDWPENTITMQKNWIGKSEGARIFFKLNNKKLEVFSTRPDTLFGVTFMVLSPEHSFLDELKKDIKNWPEVSEYIEKSRKKTEFERSDANREKTGIELKGIKAVNPATKEEIPVFTADYVLSGYGTGAIMAVPAHDQRDWDFAKKYGLKIIPVVEGGNLKKEAYCDIEEGKLINSSSFNGLKPQEAIKKITQWLEEKDLGRKETNYKLRDWLISRQRYWGAPIPIIYCDKCGEVLDENLPVKLPELDNFKPTEDGQSPLARSRKFIEVKCPKCGEKAERSAETMDTFVCSSWYYLRFLSPHLEEAAFDEKLAGKWLPVDQYCGGAEHTCLHLLYARFINRVLYDQSLINFEEPFSKLNHQGMILAEDGKKMSKSKGNAVIPDDYIEKYGADVFRTYILFLAPFDQGGSWNDQGIVGVERFLNKVWDISKRVEEKKEDEELKKILQKTIKKVGEDIESFKFNTAVSSLMIMAREMEKKKNTTKSIFEKFLILLSVFAPHLAEEIWQKLGHKESIFLGEWPAYDEKLITEEKVNFIVQLNGKVRDKLELKKGLQEKEVKKIILEREKVKKWIKGKKIEKTIFLEDKLINFVLK